MQKLWTPGKAQNAPANSLQDSTGPGSRLVLPLHAACGHKPHCSPSGCGAGTHEHRDTRTPASRHSSPFSRDAHPPLRASARRGTYPGSPGRARGRRSAAVRLRPSAAMAAAAAIAPRPPTAPGARGGSCPFPRWRQPGLTRALPRSPAVHGAQGGLCPFPAWRLHGFTSMPGGTGKALPFPMMAAAGFIPRREAARPAPPLASPSHGGHEPGAAGGRGLGGAAGGQRRDRRDHRDHRDHRDRPPPPQHPRYGPGGGAAGRGRREPGDLAEQGRGALPEAAGAPGAEQVPVVSPFLWRTARFG